MRRGNTLCAFALALALSLAAQPANAAGPGGAAARTEAIRQEIMPRVAQLRGLEFSRDVPVNVVTSGQLASYVCGTIDEQMTADEMKGFQRLLAHMGLIEPGIDLRATLIRVYSQQIAGFYDDEQKVFSIVSNSNMPRVLDEVTIAHELTHALQDQHYDLEGLRVMTEDADDAALAVMALAEGDACDLMMRYGTDYYARGAGPVKDFSPFISFSTGAENIPALPMVLAQNLVFPYAYGSRFVVALMREAGDRAVDWAFVDPPVSTEQIMNPQKYFNRDEPLDIRLPDAPGDIPEGWRLLDQSSLGQFNLGLFLANSLGMWGIEEAIRPWKGDVIAGYAGPADDDFVFVYYSTWDSSEAAMEFTRTYRRALQTRFGDLRLVRDDGARVTWMKGEFLYYLSVRGPDVLAVENAPLVSAARFIMNAWNAEKTPLGIVCPVADRDRIQPPGAKRRRPKLPEPAGQ